MELLSKSLTSFAGGDVLTWLSGFVKDLYIRVGKQLSRRSADPEPEDAHGGGLRHFGDSGQYRVSEMAVSEGEILTANAGFLNTG